MREKKFCFLKWVVLCLLAVALLSITACGPSGDQARETGGERDLEWVYEKRINEPIAVEAGPADVVLGDLEKDGITLFIPAGAFPQVTTVTLQHPESVSKVSSRDMEPVGMPILLQTDGEDSIRLEEMVTITFALPRETVDEVPDPEAYTIVYDMGGEWFYIRPSEINMEEGWLRFQTPHFSIFSYGRKAAEKRIEDYTKNKALAGWANDAVDNSTKELIKEMVTQTMDGLGMTDELNRAVFEGIMTDNEYGNMVRAVQEGNMEAFYENYAVAVGKYMARSIPDEVLSSQLTGALGWAGDLSTISKAAGAAAAGEYRQAAMELGKHITEALIKKNVMLRAASVMYEGWAYAINMWKDELVEDAYLVYKNGTQGYAAGVFGYREIEAGDFDAVWDQLNVAARELTIREINRRNESLRDAGLPLLTEEEIEDVRRLVYEKTKKEFHQRRVSEDAIVQRQALYQELIGEYMRNSIIDDYLRPPNWLNYRSSAPQEDRLDKLFDMISTIMADTQTTELTGDDRFSRNGKLSLQDLVELTEYLVQGDRENYVERIKDIFDIDLEEETGVIGIWKGQFIMRQLTGTVTRMNWDVNPPERETYAAEDFLPHWINGTTSLEFQIAEKDGVYYVVKPVGCNIYYDGNIFKLNWDTREEFGEDIDFNFVGSFEGDDRIAGTYDSKLHAPGADPGSKIYGDWWVERVR